MAVDQSTGDLLVIDASDNTLSRWREDGTPSEFSALGTNVIDGLPGGPDETGSGGILGSFDGPGEVQVAVDNSGTATDGDIYVTNSENDEVDIFASDGEYIGALTEFATGALGEPCGVAVDEDGNVYVGDFENGVHKFANPPVDGASEITMAASSPCTVAAAAGSLFATSYGGAVTKFDATSGEEEYVISPGANTTVSVDPGSGHVFAASEGNLLEYHAGATKASGITEATLVSSTELEGATTGVAVNAATGNVYAAREGSANVEVFGPWENTPQKFKFAVAEDGIASGSVECEVEGGPAEPCPVVDTEYPQGTEITITASPAPGSVFAGFSGGGCTTSPCALTLEANTTVTATFNQMPPSVANNPEGTVTSTTAILTGHVNNNGDPAGSACSFEVSLASDTDFSSPVTTLACVPSPVVGSTNTAVSATATDLDPATSYIYRVLATNTGGTGEGTPAEAFTTDTAAPTILEQRPLNATQTSVTLQARIDPNGLPTSYHFEFGADTSYGTRIPSTGEFDAGSGSEAVTTSTARSGLQEATVYYFRLVATNSKGTAVGPDQRLETLNEHGLPNDRAFELLTPADKGTSGSVALGVTFQVDSQASLDGESFVYPFTNGVASSTAGGWLHQLAKRTASGWLSKQISAPSLIPPPDQNGLEFALPSQVKYVSPDNSCGFLESYNPLTPDTSAASVELGVTNLYRWKAEGDDVSYELVTDRLPLNPESSPHPGPGDYYQRVDASDDCRRVFFRSQYEFIPDASGLYESDEGTLRDAGVLPSGEVGAEMNLGVPLVPSVDSAILGGEVDNRGTARWNAVSPDGARVFFTAISNDEESDDFGTPAIYMREDGGPDNGGQVVKVSQSATEGSPGGAATNGARFEAASPDGSRVFFRANYGIANTSSVGPPGGTCGPQGGETEFTFAPKLEPKPCDLYSYDVETGALTDLSADPSAPGAQIQGTVAIDEDGSHVYFAALGQLIPGKGRTYAENVVGIGANEGSANVYLAHDGQLSYVTTLAEHGTLPGGGGKIGDLLGGAVRTAALMRMAAWDASTSANGGELLFASSLNLTGYDTGGKDKYAAYLYSAGAGRLFCVSCRPDGLPSEALPGQSEFLLAGPGYSSRPRSINEDGSRVFFTSPDVLAPGAVARKKNVYQWQEGQVFFLAVAEGAGLKGLDKYQGASASGDDVFIASGERLAPQDVDFLSDVYDLRVNGGFPVESKPPDCQVDEAIPLLPNQIYCQGEPTPQPPAAGAGSASGENVKPAPVKCGKGKVRRGGRCLGKRRLAQRRCRKVKGKQAKRRCVRRQVRSLNRTASTHRRAAK